MKCEHCQEGYIQDTGFQVCDKCGGSGRRASPCSRLPYPLRCAEELAGCLISHGLLDESAWHDPEGWDGGIERERVYRMVDTIRADFESENA